jgi:hypothetical protein
VGEVESAGLGCPSKAFRANPVDGRSLPLLPDPHGLYPPSEAIMDPVAAILVSRRPPRRLDDLAVFQGTHHSAEQPKPPHEKLP